MLDAFLTLFYIVGHILRVRLINLLIRGLVLVSRFFFIFALAKMLPPTEIGKYGLLVAAISYSVYFVGFDFYTYTTRQISGGDRQFWGGYLKSQAALSCFLYISIFPVLIFLFASDWLPWVLAKWFFVILFFEYVCLEFIRFFIASSEQISASIVLFLSQAFWAVAVIVLMLVDDNYKELNYVLVFWCFGSVLALAYSIFKIYKMRLGGWAAGIDIGWIWSGVRIAIPMLLATLALRGIFTFDRYLISEFLSLEVAAAYVLFIGVAGTLLAFLDAAVFSFSYPGLIRFYNDCEPGLFKANMRIMFFSVVLFSISFVLCSLLVLPHLLVWLGREVYSENYHVFYWALVAIIINSFWMVFHYALYAQRRDKHIIYSHCVAFFVFLIFGFCFYFIWPQDSIFIGVCASQAAILFWKLYAYRKFTPKAFQGFLFKRHLI